MAKKNASIPLEELLRVRVVGDDFLDSISAEKTRAARNETRAMKNVVGDRFGFFYNVLSLLSSIRKEYASKFRLPANASWQEIEKASRQKSKKRKLSKKTRK